jgi:2-amino-4-hydroxy-6-hydroxymethyldihydropteridine diphosphokinase
MASAWIGLGSNLGQTESNLIRALQALDDLPETLILRVSSAYLTPPWGGIDQDDFLNAVCELATALAPQALLKALLEIEEALGRVRDGPRWGPRVLDLDLLVFDDRVVRTPRLTLPHPRLHERAFVLVPLHEIAPDLIIPGQRTVRELLEALPPGERTDIKSSGSLNYHLEP